MSMPPDPRYNPGEDAGPLVRGLLGGLAGAMAALALDAAIPGPLVTPGGSGHTALTWAVLAAEAAGAGASRPGIGAAIVIGIGGLAGLGFAYGRFRRHVPGPAWLRGAAWGVFLALIAAPALLPRGVALMPGDAAGSLIAAGVAIGEIVGGLALYGAVVGWVNPGGDRASPGSLVAATAAVAFIGAVAGCRGASREGLPSPARTPLPVAKGRSAELPAAMAVAAAGGVTFARHCSQCHGQNGAGDGPGSAVLDPAPPDLTDSEYMWRQRPNYYYGAVARGVPGTAMLRWDQVLDPMQAWDVAYFAWSRAVTAEDLQRGAAVYEAECSTCHGPDGAAMKSAELNLPDRAALSRGETEAEIGAAHPSQWRRLLEADRRALVEHVAALIYEPAAGQQP